MMINRRSVKWPSQHVNVLQLSMLHFSHVIDQTNQLRGRPSMIPESFHRSEAVADSSGTDGDVTNDAATGGFVRPREQGVRSIGLEPLKLT